MGLLLIIGVLMLGCLSLLILIIFSIDWSAIFTEIKRIIYKNSIEKDLCYICLNFISSEKYCKELEEKTDCCICDEKLFINKFEKEIEAY